MDTAKFFEAVPPLFAGGDPHHQPPVDDYWSGVAEDVVGFTSPNELAVLNLAATLLPPGEAYLEVGTFKGRSLAGAVRNLPAASAGGPTFYAMENFLEFGMAGEQARTELEKNLARYGADADVRLIEGDCFALMTEPGVIDQPIGVYFYDGEHTYLSHYLALAIAEPLLADEALVLVDDATWPVVQRAHRLFLKSHPGWEITATWDAKEADDPLWANGLHALTFKRTAPSRISARDEALRKYQTRVQDKLNSAAWKAAGVMPGVVKNAARVVMSRSRAIGDRNR